jgi:predicted alpha/beta hydrolase
MGVPGHYYYPLLRALSAGGLNAAVFDLRGQGESSVRATGGTDFGYDEIARYDLPAAIDTAAKLYPDSPLFVLGHSLGGQMACLYAGANTDRIAGVILVACGSCYFGNWAFPANLFVLLGTSAAQVIAGIVGFFPGQQLGFGGRQARRLIRDWATQARTGRYAAWGNHTDFELVLAQFERPVLAININGDQLAPRIATQHLCSKMPRAELDHLSIDVPAPGTRPHFSWVRQPHRIVTLVLDWIGSVTNV